MDSSLFFKGLLPGTPAPAFRLLDTQGRSVGLDDFSGRPVILLFFGAEFFTGDVRLLERFAAAHDNFQARGIAVLALSARDWESLHHLERKLALPYPLLFDPGCRVARLYQAMRIPKFLTGRAVYVLDADHRVAFTSPDATPSDVFRALAK